MKFLDADFKRLLVSVSAIVDEGHTVVFGEHEHQPEDSDEQEARRVCGAAGRTSGYEIDEDGEV